MSKKNSILVFHPTGKLSLAESLVRRQGAEVVFAQNLEDASAALQALPLALLLVDLEQTGQEAALLLSQLKALPKASELTFLIIAPGLVEFEGMDQGLVDFVHKPFHPKALQSKLECLLRLAAPPLAQSQDSSPLDLVQASPQPMLLVQEGQVQAFNPPALSLLGLAGLDCPSPLLWLVEEADRPHCQDLLDQAQAGFHHQLLHLIGAASAGLLVEVTAHPVLWRGEQALVLGLNKTSPKELRIRQLKRRLTQGESLLDSLPIPVFFQDPQGHYLDCNQSFCDLLGLKPEEVVGKTAFDLAPSDLASIYSMEDDIILASHKPHRYESKLIAKGGLLTEAAFYKAPLFDQEGELVGMVGSILDVTDSRLTRVKILESETRYRLLFAAMLNGFVLCELLMDQDFKAQDYRFLEMNPAFERLTGLERQKALGQTWSSLMPGGIQPWAKTLAQVAIDRKPLHFRTLAPHLGRHFEVSAFSPKLGQFAVIFSDVTALAQAKESLQQILTTSNEGFARMDKEGKILEVNPCLARMLETNSQELLGKLWRSLVMEADREHYSLQAHKMELGEPDSRRYRTKTASGQALPLLVAATPIQDSKGVVSGFFVMASDLTEIQQVEVELQEAKEKAEQAGQAKAEFLATMTHEIRTPMNGILGMAALLRSSKLSADQKEYVEHIQYSAESLLLIINEVLDLSKLDAGKLELRQEPFDLITCLEDCLEVFAVQAAERQIELQVLVQPQVAPYVLGDASRLRQVVINLVGNAVKFTHKGQVLVKVDLVEDGSEDMELQISVSDTGRGIAKDKLDQLFEAFEQADPSPQGTGLGLTISKRLVDLMGGRIWVESSLGEGSTFFFTLRLGKQQRQDKELDPALADLQGKKFLLLVSNLLREAALVRLLEPLGVQIILAENPAQAYRILQREDITLFLVERSLLDESQLVACCQMQLSKGAKQILLQQVLDPRHDSCDGCNSFYLTLPLKSRRLYQILVQIALANQKNASAAEHQAEANPEQGAPKRLQVLVAEDDRINQMVASQFLKSLGHQVTLADQGREVLELVERQEFDLILMDIQMPEMDGLAATQALRKKWPAGRGPLIVGLSAYAMPGDKERFLAQGMEDYLTKPVHKQDLEMLIQNWSSRLWSRQDEPAKSLGLGQSPYDHLDTKVLERLGRQEPGFVERLVKLFQEEAPQMVSKLAKAGNSQDWPEVQRLSHQLAGMCANLGAMHLASLVRRMENTPLDVDQLVDIQSELEKNTQDAVRELENWLHPR